MSASRAIMPSRGATKGRLLLVILEGMGFVRVMGRHGGACVQPRPLVKVVLSSAQIQKDGYGQVELRSRLLQEITLMVLVVEIKKFGERYGYFYNSCGGSL